jgi:hypothetical protein
LKTLKSSRACVLESVGFIVLGLPALPFAHETWYRLIRPIFPPVGRPRSWPIRSGRASQPGLFRGTEALGVWLEYDHPVCEKHPAGFPIYAAGNPLSNFKPSTASLFHVYSL